MDFDDIQTLTSLLHWEQDGNRLEIARVLRHNGKESYIIMRRWNFRVYGHVERETAVEVLHYLGMFVQFRILVTTYKLQTPDYPATEKKLPCRD